jgi:hypothetical protein
MCLEHELRSILKLEKNQGEFRQKIPTCIVIVLLQTIIQCSCYKVNLQFTNSFRVRIVWYNLPSSPTILRHSYKKHKVGRFAYFFEY